MLRISFALHFLLLFAGHSLWSEEALEATSQPKCADCIQTTNPVTSLLISQCKAENYLLNCDRQLVNHPNRKNLISDCSEAEVNQSAMLLTPEHLDGCLKGLGILKDQVKDITLKVYNHLKDANNAHNLWLAELEMDVRKKRAYVESENVAYLAKLSDSELNAMSAERLNLEVVKFKTQLQQAELSAGNKVVPYPRPTVMVSSEKGDTPYKALMRFASQSAKSFALQPLCLKPKPRAAYLCYVTAYSFSFMFLGGGSTTRQAALKLLEKETPDVAAQISVKTASEKTALKTEGITSSVQTLSIGSKSAPKYTPYQREKLINQLVDKFKDRRVVNPGDNESFVEIAGRRNISNRSAILVTENPILKKLNTVSKRPEIADAINNRHKDLLFKNEQLLKTKYKISTKKYSAYKEGNLAVSDADFATIDQFNHELHETTFREFSKDPEIIAVSEKYDIDVADLVRAGTGPDYTTAKIYAREGRRQTDPYLITGPNTPGATEALKRALVNIDQLQVQLTTKKLPNGVLLRDTDVMQKIEVETMGTHHTSYRWIPSQKTLEILRKSQGDGEKFSSQIKKIFNIELPNDTRQALMDYANNTDRFITDALVVKPESLSLPNTPYGVVAIDLPGIGAANQFEIAKQLAGVHRRVDGAFLASKLAEETVTKKLDLIRTQFKATTEKVLGQDGAKVIHSGDDIFVVFQRDISKDQQQALVSELSKIQGYGPPRFATSRAISTPQYSETLQHGLGLEKVLREDLQGELPWRRLEDITIHIEIPETVGLNETGEISLMLHTRSGSPLTPLEESVIRNRLEPSAIRFYKDLNKTK